MISAMNFVQIVGPRERFDQTVDVVHDAGVLQVEEVPLAEQSAEGLLQRVQLSSAQLRQKDLFFELFHILEDEALEHVPPAMIWQFKESATFVEQYNDYTQQDETVIAATVRALHAEVRSFRRRLRNIDHDLRVLTAYEEVVTALVPLIEQQDLPSDYTLLGVVFERKSVKARALLQEHLTRLTAGHAIMLQTSLTRGRIAAILAFDPEFLERVRDFVAEAGISEVRGPHYLRDKPFGQILKILPNDLKTLQKKRVDLCHRRDLFLESKGPQLVALRNVCSDAFNRLDALSKFARTSYTFILEGWMPSRAVDALRRSLAQTCGEAVSIRCIRPHGAAGSPPVRLNNPRPVRFFEPLLGLLPLPQYGSIDPTWYMAAFFPPIFGLMLGDVGYGLLLALGVAWLWHWGRTRKLVRSLVVVLGSCAFFSIFFGVVFGEYFGSAGRHLGLHPLWRERLDVGSVQIGETLLIYLGAAVVIGVVQVLCGIVLGIVNARRSHHPAEWLGHIARLCGLFGLFFVVGRLVNLLPPVFTSLGVVAWILFLVFMLWTCRHHVLHGAMLPLELLSTVGNILSYARIMAVGLASAVLALLANRFGHMIDSVIIAAIVVVLVHALNLVLGVVDPTIQGLRLQYVEFFSKFYLTGGRLYSPFKKVGD